MRVVSFVFFLMMAVYCQQEDTCIKYGSCTSCSNSGDRCGWCASDAYGGGSCLKYDGTGAPVGTCASEYWRKACCSGYDSCDECANSGERCQWCEYGSNVNGGTCIPKDGQGPLLWVAVNLVISQIGVVETTLAVMSVLGTMDVVNGAEKDLTLILVNVYLMMVQVY